MRKLKSQVTCLNCWAKFAPEDVKWQSEHRDLLGDPLLGENVQLRFLANRFDINGNAIDARDQICRDIACPTCHLPLPRSLLEREPLFISILGTPSCGKSYYLAALASKLRRDLPVQFKVDFTDADPVSNQHLIAYEEQLFLNEQPDDYVALADLVPKTQLGGSLYNSVRFGEQQISLPRPLSFSMQPLSDHPNHDRDSLNRLVCLYDNAGEHFLPGQDTRTAPGTRHLAESSYLLFLFDPTQDPRWHAAVRKADPSVNFVATRHAGRQEGVLREAAMRIRRLRGMTDNAKYDRPLIVVLSKADMWQSLLGPDDYRSPLFASNRGMHAIGTEAVLALSGRLRRLLMENLPELAIAAESFCDRVYYLPASALGTSPRFDANGRGSIRPRDIQPALVTIPFLLGLSLVTQGLIPKTA